MQPNQAILAGGVVIITVGFASATVNNRPKTPVFVGGVGIVLFASLIEMIGGNAAKLATAFMGLAVVAVLLVELPDVATALSKATQHTSTSTTGGGSVPTDQVIPHDSSQASQVPTFQGLPARHF